MTGERERPILFSAPMVRAILDGTKNQTRRILKVEVPPAPAMDAIHPNNVARHPAPYLDAYCGERKTAENPRGMGTNWCWWTRDDRCGRTFKVRWAVGDRLWVREAAAIIYESEHHIDGHQHQISYAAGGSSFRKGNAPNIFPNRTFKKDGSLRFASSIHMPRWASRITLRVTDVRVQRLHDISEADALSEGAPQGFLDEDGKFYQSDRGSFYAGFAGLWDHINGSGAWDANPWVVAISFVREIANG